MKFPIILFDTDKNKLQQSNVIKSNSFHFYSYQNFSIEILDGIGELYSVKQVGTGPDATLETIKGQALTDNIGYTLYIPTNHTSVVIRVLNSNGDQCIYTFRLELDNIIDATNQHYLDLLYNYNLPAFDELKPATIKEFDDSELLKRLLLDFMNIVRYKGTKKSVLQFLKFLGFDADNIKIFDEYLNTVSKARTLNPDKTKDVKTGDYHVLYENYRETGYDDNNMPIRIIEIQDLSSFKESLLHAINIANTYFTLKEQDITFFGLTYSSNIPYEHGVTSNTNIINQFDVYNFRKHINISMRTNENQYSVIQNSVQIQNQLFSSEGKVYKPSSKIAKMYLVEREINDGEVIDDPENTNRIFGNVLHLKINSPKTYIEYELIDDLNPVVRVVKPKTWYGTDTSIYDIIAVTNISTYTMIVKVTDEYNNQEKYIYKFGVSVNKQRINFQSFNSVIIKDEHKFVNDINLDVQNPTEVDADVADVNKNYVLPIDQVPDNLKNYFNNQSLLNVRWLSATEGYELPEINDNYLLEDITETIPLYHIGNWIDLVSLKYDPEWELKVRLYDADNCKEIITGVANLGTFDKAFDHLYVMVVDIYDPETTLTEAYYFITTTIPGIDINETTYDFVLVNKTTNEIKSIFGDDVILEPRKKLQINYDFPLFEIGSDIVPDFQRYISPVMYTEKAGLNHPDKDYGVVKSIFPRLINIDNANDNIDVFYLKLGDVFLCRLDSKYVVNETNIEWKVLNSFTKEILYTTIDTSLKYRITDNVIFDVMCTFKIAGQEYNIYKESLFSSF